MGCRVTWFELDGSLEGILSFFPLPFVKSKSEPLCCVSFCQVRIEFEWPDPVTVGGTATASANASDNLSGLASQSCGTPDTSTADAKNVACSAADNAGNIGIANANYTVSNGGYNFTGFFQRVDNLPILNEVKAGSSIPVKFSLGGNFGLNIFAAGYPASGMITCNSSTPADVIEETVNAGGNSLTYDAASNRYHYVWKTDKSWKGQCRMLIVKLNDGNTYFAQFRFK